MVWLKDIAAGLGLVVFIGGMFWLVDILGAELNALYTLAMG